MAKSHKERSAWKRLHDKYKLSIYNESTLKEESSWRVSRMNVILLFVFASVVLAGFLLFLVISTPLKNFLPGYLKEEARSRMVENALMVDSLTRKAQMQESYLANIQRIMSGEINTDSIPPLTSDSIWIFPADSLGDISDKTKAFIAEYEEQERFNLTIFEEKSTKGEQLAFFPPARGILTRPFSLGSEHFGVDIELPQGTAIASVQEGTVIACYYTIEFGYVIEVQHADNLISKYKYNQALLKKVGDHVIAGEKIALAGNNSTQREKPAVIEFQLWQNGTPLNPENHIEF